MLPKFFNLFKSLLTHKSNENPADQDAKEDVYFLMISVFILITKIIHRHSFTSLLKFSIACHVSSWAGEDNNNNFEHSQ
jgi:hypothetical protein